MTTRKSAASLQMALLIGFIIFALLFRYVQAHGFTANWFTLLLAIVVIILAGWVFIIGTRDYIAYDRAERERERNSNDD